MGLVWREFGGLNLDQWVLGNGQVSISAIKLAYLSEIQKRAHLNQDISSIPPGASGDLSTIYRVSQERFLHPALDFDHHKL